MKLKLISFLLLFAISITKAVSQVPDPGTNTPRSYLDKFEGTWIWSNGNSEITFKLKKLNYYFTTSQYHEDIIVGSHKYINNGTLIENYLPEFATISQTSLSSMFLWANMDGTLTDEISGTVQDQNKHKKVSINLTFVAGAIPSLVCHIQERADVIVVPMLPGVTLPEDIILVKQ